MDLLAWGEKPATIQDRFERFHAANPQVFAKLVELARSAKESGLDKLAIGTLWERLRWYERVERIERDREGYLLNDHFRSRYVRLLIETLPEFDGFFELRALRTE